MQLLLCLFNFSNNMTDRSIILSAITNIRSIFDFHIKHDEHDLHNILIGTYNMLKKEIKDRNDSADKPKYIKESTMLIMEGKNVWGDLVLGYMRIYPLQKNVDDTTDIIYMIRHVIVGENEDIINLVKIYLHIVVDHEINSISSVISNASVYWMILDYLHYY